MLGWRRLGSTRSRSGTGCLVPMLIAVGLVYGILLYVLSRG